MVKSRSDYPVTVRFGLPTGTGKYIVTNIKVLFYRVILYVVVDEDEREEWESGIFL